MIQTVRKSIRDEIVTGYKITYTNGETWFAPNIEGNRHFQEVQEWIAEGNTPEEAE